MGEQRASGRRRPGVAGVPHAPGTHVPVLLDRILDLLGPALAPHPAEPAESGGRPVGSAEPGGHPSEPAEPGGRQVRSGGRPAVFVDATVGLGGHAEAVLAAHPGTTLVGLDRDPEALRRSGERLAGRDEEIHLVHAVYDELPDVLADLDIDGIDAALFDLGVSSLQLDEAERGFAYAQDAPLDMRMDPTTGITAEQVVNTYEPAELTRILRVYGEERYASRIAAAIVRARAQAPLTSSARLADLVRDAIPAPARRTGGHPAKRTFQALRIEVNGELAALESALPAAVDALRVGGRIAVLSYHSLEDRIVKRELAGRARSTAPPDLPVVPPGSEPELRLLTRGGQEPTDAEIAANPRAASARLRAAERVRAAGHTTTGRTATGPKTRPGGTATRPKRRLLGDDVPPGDRPARQVPGEES